MPRYNYHRKYRWDYDIQLFGGEGGSAGAGDGGSAAAPGGDIGTGVNEAGAADRQRDIDPRRARRQRQNPLADVQYGRTEDDAAQSISSAERRSFEDLIKGEYKEDFGKAVSAIVQERLKNSKNAQAQLDRLSPMLSALAQKYNVADGDYDKISAAIMDDDSLYEDEAIERGMSVDSLKAIKQLERENARMKEQQQLSAKEQQTRAHFNKLAQQADMAKQYYPQFDMQTEMQNPEFVRLTSPGVGIDVRTAYEIVHREEMRGAEMQYAAQRRAADMSRAIQSGSRRPSEAGMSKSSGRAVAKTDPTTLTKMDREEIKRRVRAGEKIVF